MSIPGLMMFAAQPLFVITSSATDYDLFVAMGSPVGAIDFVLIMNSGVVIDSSDPTIPAFDTGAFPAGSTCILFQNNGEIKGAGGSGGLGGISHGTWDPESADPIDPGYNGGGGGGGGGRLVGPGASNGLPGTETAGGDGGVTSAWLSEPGVADRDASPGDPGGHAMNVTIDFTQVDNANGKIWSGGGGGGGGGERDDFPLIGADASNGGAPGLAGDTTPNIFTATGGAPGNAVKLGSGRLFTFSSGSGDPNVKGAVAE